MKTSKKDNIKNKNTSYYEDSDLDSSSCMDYESDDDETQAFTPATFEELIEFKKKIQNNPFNYENHVNYISVLRKDPKRVEVSVAPKIAILYQPFGENSKIQTIFLKLSLN